MKAKPISLESAITNFVNVQTNKGDDQMTDLLKQVEAKLVECQLLRKKATKEMDIEMLDVAIEGLETAIQLLKESDNQ
jgi:hypothetical protein